jgi:hypothetical protein
MIAIPKNILRKEVKCEGLRSFANAVIQGPYSLTSLLYACYCPGWEWYELCALNKLELAYDI